jgi:EF-P beta-lysylation protein EpmB
MVPRSTVDCQTMEWKRNLADSFRCAEDLLAALGLTPDDIPDLDAGAPGFGMLVPRGFAALMSFGDAQDPLLKQVLPLGAERLSVAGFSMDPVGDASAAIGDGLLEKYAGRALMMVTGACAVHCRYCFRRHFPYASFGPSADRISAAVERIAGDSGISEVILSGGDPLMLDDGPVGDLLGRLGGIAHLKRIRIHTRLPVVLPSRITERLCTLLADSRRSVLVVIHANHGNELGSAAEAALLRLKRAGLPLLNQSVLLRGINDSADILGALSERLFECGVLPYYLHQLDPVQGAAHLEVSDRRALELDQALRDRLPGYLVPRLVREIRGAASKTPLADAPGRQAASPLA